MAQSEQEILAGIAELVNEETGLPTESVELDKSFTEDLDIDSLSMTSIVVQAEDKFGVKIPDEDIKNLEHRPRRRQLRAAGTGLTAQHDADRRRSHPHRRGTQHRTTE